MTLSPHELRAWSKKVDFEPTHDEPPGLEPGEGQLFGVGKPSGVAQNEKGWLSLFA